MRPLAIALVLATCKPFSPPEYGQRRCNPLEEGEADRPLAFMDFTARASFFSAPFPSLGRVPGDHVGKGLFPASTSLALRLRRLAPDRGGISSAIFFGLSGGVRAGTLPPRDKRLTPEDRPSVLLFPIDHPRELAPINVHAARSLVDPPHGDKPETPHLLSLLPVQGVPLHPHALYVAIVTTEVATQATTMKRLCDHDVGALPYSDVLHVYQQAIGLAQTELGIDCSRIAAMSVFMTADPAAREAQVHALARKDFLCHQAGRRITLVRDGDATDGPRCQNSSFCVYKGTVDVPVYQQGTPPYLPYLDWNGNWPECDPPIDASCDAPRPRCYDTSFDWTPRWRTARVIVTVPRAPIAAGRRGYPPLVVARTGGGSDTDTLVDRGPILPPSCKASACRGPAEVLQSIGFAGVSVDGPLVGVSRKEPIEIDEDLGIFDFLNPDALQDNIRQSGVELGLVPDVLDLVDFDRSKLPCEGPTEIKLDLDHIALFAHSMGATIAPLALANQPRYGAAILSGSGGSMIMNALYKKKPVPINAAASLLGYSCAPQVFDPQLSLLEWALEPSDAQSYVRTLVTDGSASARHVLMIQGLVDHYILPPIADVTTLGAGLDLGVGPSSCSMDPFCDRAPVRGESALETTTGETPPSIGDLLGDVGHGRVIALPAGGNRPWPASVPRRGYAGDLTAMVVQHRIDENRELGADACNVDGHEVIYESELARHQWACLLDDFANDATPMVRASGRALGSCR